MDKQQIKSILDNAPDWANEFYERAEGHKTGYSFDGFAVNHALSDLRTQFALIEENEKLKASIAESVQTRLEPHDYTHHEYCNFCNENLTKANHEDDCILKELSND